MSTQYRHHRRIPERVPRATASLARLRLAADRLEREVARAVALRCLQLMASDDALVSGAMAGEFHFRELRSD